jgi:hypothetical protein
MRPAFDSVAVALGNVTHNAEFRWFVAIFMPDSLCVLSGTKLPKDRKACFNMITMPQRPLIGKSSSVSPAEVLAYSTKHLIPEHFCKFETRPPKPAFSRLGSINGNSFTHLDFARRVVMIES